MSSTVYGFGNRYSWWGPIELYTQMETPAIATFNEIQ